MFSNFQQQQHHNLFHISRECQTSEEDDSRGSGGPATLTPHKPFSAISGSSDGATIEIGRRPRGRPPDSKNKPKFPLIITHEPEPAMSPHVLKIPEGSDIVEAISRFSNRRKTGLCILTGSGVVANVTLRQPSAPPGTTVIFHGRFNILSISATSPNSSPLSSLPEIVEKPESDRGGLLISKELLKNYRDMCSVSKACETSLREFPIKCMNILDPLKSDNNLGRSVNKSTSHRIGYAFAFGAEKLKEILNLRGESMVGALELFFMNTLNRSGKGQRPDIDVLVPAFGTGRSGEPVLVGDCDSFYGGLQHAQMYRNYAMLFGAPSSSPPIPFDVDTLKVNREKHTEICLSP